MTNEVQRFDILGSPGSGKFTLDFNGAVTDPPLPCHPPAGDVQRALEALPTVGGGNVLVGKDGNWGYVCSFLNELGDRNVALLIADDSQLGGGATIAVSVVTEGAELPPPEGGPPEVELSTPCSVADLQQFVRTVSALTPANHRYTPVTTSDTAITVVTG